MKHVLIFLVTSIFSNCSFSADDEFLNSGNGFISLAAENRYAAIQFVKGYVFGYSTALAVTLVSLDDSRPGIESDIGKQRLCIPQGATTSQALDVVLKYLDRHPGRRHDSMAVLSWEAIADAWPCKKQ